MNAPIVVSAIILLIIAASHADDSGGEPGVMEPHDDEVHAVWSVVSAHNDVGAAVLDGAGVGFYPDLMQSTLRIKGMIPARSTRGVPMRTVYTSDPPLLSSPSKRVLFRVLRPFSRSQMRVRLLLSDAPLEVREQAIRGLVMEGWQMDYFWHGSKRCTLVGMSLAGEPGISELPDIEPMMIALSKRLWPAGVQVTLHNPFAGEVWCLRDGTWNLVGRYGGAQSGEDQFGGMYRRMLDYPVWGMWPEAPGGSDGGHRFISMAPPG